MKLPGPDHPITITQSLSRWRARFGDHVIADSGDALVLQEATYPQVVYFPRQDVSMEFLTATERCTYCPFKGDATYFTVMMDGRFGDNAVWSYEEPYPAMAQIRGHLAFYTNKVEVYEVDEALVSSGTRLNNIDEVVQHTDTGSGHSQRDHWPASR